MSEKAEKISIKQLILGLFYSIFSLKLIHLRAIKLRTVVSFAILFFIFSGLLIYYQNWIFESIILKEREKWGESVANLLAYEVMEHNLQPNTVSDNDRKLIHLHVLSLKLLNIRWFNNKGTLLYSYNQNSEVSHADIEKVLLTLKLKKVNSYKNHKGSFDNILSQEELSLAVYVPTTIGVFVIYQDMSAQYDLLNVQRAIYAIAIIGFIIFSYLILILIFRQLVERENELRFQKEKAERANLSKDIFLAKVTHEIKNPLNAVLGFGELIKMRIEEEKSGIISKKESDEILAEDIGMILESGKAIKRFIDDLANFRKIKDGTLDIVYEDIFIEEVIKNIYDFVKINLNKKGISFKADYHPIIYTIKSDKIRLNQIINNLIGNAIKFTEKGVISVYFELEGLHLKISVSDTGIGLSNDELKKIFNEFYQAKYKLGDHYEGLGLGLAITRQVVELMGGTISVSSQPDIGTKFIILLPQ